MSVRKMTVVPVIEEHNYSIPESKAINRRRGSMIDKIQRLLKIVLKIADIKGYDYMWRIKRTDGKTVDNSNIINLLLHAMSPGKLLVGEKEFIDLLYKANVDADLIINDNVKAKLTSLYENKNRLPTTTITKAEDEQVSEVNRKQDKLVTGIKRKQDEDNELSIKRIKTNGGEETSEEEQNWEVPDYLTEEVVE